MTPDNIAPKPDPQYKIAIEKLGYKIEKVLDDELYSVSKPNSPPEIWFKPRLEEIKKLAHHKVHILDRWRKWK